VACGKKILSSGVYLPPLIEVAEALAKAKPLAEVEVEDTEHYPPSACRQSLIAGTTVGTRWKSSEQNLSGAASCTEAFGGGSRNTNYRGVFTPFICF
jgi:hypothetical protein